MEFDPHTRERPKNFVWCGEDCIAVSWPNRGILLVSPYCDYLRFDYDVSHEPLFLLQEIDSLRVFSRFHHDIIRAVFLFAHSHLKVPPPIYNVYSMGSQTPGAILRSAFARFAQKAGERDMEEGVGDLRDDLLDSAVKECIDAAEEELSSLLQEELLRSASYGQNYLQNMTHSFQKVDFRKTTGAGPAGPGPAGLRGHGHQKRPGPLSRNLRRRGHPAPGPGERGAALGRPRPL